jgi:hypothetical protein
MNVRKIRELTLHTPASPGRPPHLSAASGLVQVGEFLYVIADDEQHLGIFCAGNDTSGDLLPLLTGAALPLSSRQRKALKPDFEVLTYLPALPDYSAGALLALASGSRANRCSGALLPLRHDGALTGAVHSIDLTGIYAVLRHRLGVLNIEGAACVGAELILLQRGNKKTAINASIHLPLAAVLNASNDHDFTASMISIEPMDLGTINGIPLCFSDAAALPDGSLIFTAIAENTDNSYDDGPCAGAAIGIMDGAGRLNFMENIEANYKIEGIAAQVDRDTIRLLLVTDADDAAVPSCLLAAEISGYPFAGG